MTDKETDIGIILTGILLAITIIPIIIGIITAIIIGATGIGYFTIVIGIAILIWFILLVVLYR